MLEEILVQTSATVYNNNQGAVLLVTNSQVSQRTKHIGIQQHFVRDLQKQKKVVSEFVQTKTTWPIMQQRTRQRNCSQSMQEG